MLFIFLSWPCALTSMTIKNKMCCKCVHIMSQFCPPNVRVYISELSFIHRPASLTSTVSAPVRGDRFTSFSCHFVNCSSSVSKHFYNYLNRFQQVKKALIVSPTASYIISFRHFQALTISTVTFLFLIFGVFLYDF